MKYIRITYLTLLFFILTLLTQIGGVLLLVSLLFNPFIIKLSDSRLYRALLKVFIYIIIYLVFTFCIIPYLAPFFGRVALPAKQTNYLRPWNSLTVILNRRYVQPELRNTLYDVALKFNRKYPGSLINYLDAGFPFIDKFPLFPHLSHNDGKKVDLSFCYISAATGNPTRECPSWIGYGISEEPKKDEVNFPEQCEKKGYWKYSLINHWVSQKNKDKFIFDSVRTACLINLLSSEASISKIFIEPHLKYRLKLTSEKIRFHGCGAVRHDDHIHIQMK
jgi:hypothetical protein